MSTDRTRFFAAIFFLLTVALWGCAPTRQEAKPTTSTDQPVSVRLPVITPTKIEPPSAPPGARTPVTHTDVVEGQQRSLNMIEFHYHGAAGTPAEDNAAIPAGNEETP